jgi:hypothetical protein
MSILNDIEIKDRCLTNSKLNLIYPFIDSKIRECVYKPVLSF